MNYDSVKIFNGKAEPYLLTNGMGVSYQLLRKGYYKTVNKNDKLILSEITSMKDSFKPKQ